MSVGPELNNRVVALKRGFFDEMPRIFEIDEQITALELKIIKLKNEKIELEIKLDEMVPTLRDGLVERITTVAKAKKVNTCGHPNPGTDCPECEANEKLCTAPPQKFVDHIVQQAKFTVLVFYRGSWCDGCMNYLRELDPLVAQVQKMGGEILGICAQEAKVVIESKKSWGLIFPLVSDPKCILAKKYGMEITGKSSFAFKNISMMLKKVTGASAVLDEDYDEGLSHPGIVILQPNHTIVYSWKSVPDITNSFGGDHRVAPEDIVKLATFYFTNQNVVDSVKTYVREHRDEVHKSLLTNSRLRVLFTNHLNSEYCGELLEFHDAVEQWEKDGFPEMGLQEIYSEFICDSAPRQINISGIQRNNIVDAMRKNKEPTLQEHVYTDAMLHVNYSLDDSMTRFVIKQEFIDAASEVIPSTFLSKY
jgi:peroxiredoxin